MKNEEIKKFVEPGAVDIMEKGDDTTEEPVVVYVNRNTNRGRRQRRRNEALKNKKAAKIATESNKYDPRRGWVDENGRVRYLHNSDRQKLLKKVANKKIRSGGRNIDEEDVAVYKKDSNWFKNELY